MRRVPYALVVTAVAATGCALPFVGGGSPDDTPADDTPVVQIRDFPRSAHVSVLVWSPAEAQVGLRADVRRDGTIAGSYRLGDHTLYLGTTLVRVMGGFMRASIPPDPLVLWTSGRRDNLACNRTTDRCAPVQTVRLGVPDSLLRANRDSLTVRFASDWARDWTVVVPGEVVTTYLRVVDSVSAAQRPHHAAR